jgi:hypothetical protein
MVKMTWCYRSGPHARRAILAALALNALVVLVGVSGFRGPQTATANSISQSQPDSGDSRTAERCARWAGQARLPVGTIIVESLEEDGAAASRVLGELAAPCSILKISVSITGSESPVTIEPSSIRLLSTQGTIEALTADDVLPVAGQDADSLARHFGVTPVVAPAGKPCVATGLFPCGIDMHQVAAITLRVNGKSVTVPGRLVTSQEK